MKLSFIFEYLIKKYYSETAFLFRRHDTRKRNKSRKIYKTHWDDDKDNEE